MMSASPLPLCLALAIVAGAYHSCAAEESRKATEEKVSYFKEIRPLFQAHCLGCHQPARAKGDYVMTPHEKLVAGGSSGKKAILPNNADASHLVKLITPVNGKASMPEGKKPLHDTEIELIRRWVAQGAVDDTPANAKSRFDLDHPPVYVRPPVISSLDYSPDGKLLAVSGFHEIFLVDADQGERVARLIGMSERIQSVRFSPDGTLLAASGGQPGRMGEVQVWDVAKKKLKLSVPVTYDTVYGVSWSPDGTKLAFGGTDNSLRVIDAASGEQILFQGSHSDWVLDTLFSPDGKHVVSGSRDMSIKITEIATQRMLGNVTSITPGALKGGVQAMSPHPKQNSFIAGGSDGVTRLYTAALKSNSQTVSTLPGRVFAARFSADGKKLAAASSLGGKGYLFVGPFGSGGKALATISTDQGGLYALAFRPGSDTVAAAGYDGVVRVYDAANGKRVQEFSPAPIDVAAQGKEKLPTVLHWPKEAAAPESLPAGATIEGLEVEPKSLALDSPFSYTQLLVTARLKGGATFDATRVARIAAAEPVVEITPLGMVRAKRDGQTKLTITVADKTIQAPVQVSGMKAEMASDFIRDVNPILGRLGCNSGSCHGANKGKNGFKLSLRGVDAAHDVQAFVDDLATRRVNIASAENSLMLMKATGATPHGGGQLTRPGEPYYETIRDWIARGCTLNADAPRVVRLDLYPRGAIVERAGEKQQFRAIATYTDGTSKDVTREAIIESGNIEIVAADKAGLITALTRGESPVLARFEGAYTATTIIVMGDRTGFVWKDPPAFNKIDELVAAKWKRMKIAPSELCTDLEFLRRVQLDLTGLPPTADEVRAFMLDGRDSKTKREALVDQLIGSADYVDHWTNKWADLLQVNRKFLGSDGAAAFRAWIRNEIDKNTPYDAFAQKILTATGSNKENPAASYWKILRDAPSAMENTTHLFLGIRFNCNKCHDHPFERWTQDQYYQTAAYFAQFSLQEDPTAKGQKIGGTAVVEAKPLYEIVSDRTTGEIKHERTGIAAPPQFPYPASANVDEKAPRRAALASWLTSRDNVYFARSYANRMWGYLLGIGLIEPIDDLRAGNPPTNPELLDFLTEEFLKSNLDVRKLQRLIVTSRTYQLSVASNRWNQDDKTNYSHALARRLPAEAIYDAMVRVTGSPGKLPGGIRAAALPDAGIDLKSGFLATTGRPIRESACECERTTGLQMGPVMALINGQDISEMLADPKNEIARIVKQQTNDAKMVDELFLRILNRPAQPREIEVACKLIADVEADHQKMVLAVSAREVEAAVLKAKLENERKQNIARSKAELETYEAAIAPKVAQAAKERTERIAQADKALKDYVAALDARQPAWEKSLATDVTWVPLKATAAAATNAKLDVQADNSLVASGAAGPDTYTVSASTDLKGITAVRLEMLADASLPKNGPGRAADGNFVLTEFQLLVQPRESADAPKKVELTTPLADFSQGNFDVKLAVDGDETSPDKGWGIAPQSGKGHWATFQLKEAVGFDKGTKLTFKLICRHKLANSTPGRFRISVAAAKTPVHLSVSEEWREILLKSAAERTDAQKDMLAKMFRGNDGELSNRQKALAAAQVPLPVDPRLVDLRTSLAEVTKAVPEDARLVQLRQDLAMSTRQLADRRLTAAQDIAWALINSPAFLFNR